MIIIALTGRKPALVSEWGANADSVNMQWDCGRCRVGLHLGPSRSDWQSFLLEGPPPLGASGVLPPPPLIFSTYQHLESDWQTQQREHCWLTTIWKSSGEFLLNLTTEQMCWRCTAHNLFEWFLIAQGACSWLGNTMHHCNVAAGNM